MSGGPGPGGLVGMTASLTNRGPGPVLARPVPADRRSRAGCPRPGQKAKTWVVEPCITQLLEKVCEYRTDRPSQTPCAVTTTGR